MRINPNYQNLEDSYLFITIANKVAAYTEANPGKELIRLGIGDVTLPLPQAVIAAMKSATDEMAETATFRGYGDEQGYGFLQEAIQGYYGAKGVDLSLGEIFVSDGAKSDIGNILDLFSKENTVVIPDPVYPVYVDTNIMAGRTVVFVNGTQENEFLPMPNESIRADIIYLCSPNNPTGGVYNKEQLEAWVEYARMGNAIILFDAAYEAFVSDDTLPTSIYQIEGAKECAIEFCSLSKTAGFTGTRCGYTIVPNALVREGASLGTMWRRRQTTKFNGVPYIVQRGAEAVFSPEGLAQSRANVAYYMGNARLISKSLAEAGIWHVGGKNAPYIWLKCPDGMDSWSYFDYLLERANVVGTPGIGFGAQGEGYFRLTAFNTRENTEEAIRRILAAK